MIRWRDPLTQALYEVDDTAVSAIRQHLVEVLQRDIESARWLELRGAEGDDPRLKEAADSVARFWSEHYPQLIYPIRLTANVERPQEAFSVLHEASPTGQRPLLVRGPFRSRYLGPGQPPILPASALGLAVPETLLASEWALSASAFAICAWKVRNRQNLPPRDGAAHDEPGSSLSDEDLAAVRLGILLFPLWNTVLASRGILHELAGNRRIRAVAAALEAPTPALEATSWGEIIEAIRRPQSAPNWVRQEAAGVVIGAAQRIKQYVFESPSLPQIRGGSILIERVLDVAASKVADTLGPECVIRKAGGVLAAVVPNLRGHGLETWERELEQLFFRYTASARFAAGSAPLPLSAVLPPSDGSEFATSQSRALSAIDRSRGAAEEPRWETLPFEERCESCGERAAEPSQVRSPEGEPLRLCAVCLQRLEVGRHERGHLIEEVWNDVGVDADPFIAGDRENRLPASLEGLVPVGWRRRWIAMVYGDGNNFGSIVQSLRGLAEHLHWTRRLYWTVRGLTEMSLVGATAFLSAASARAAGRDTSGAVASTGPAFRFQHYPFEVLAIGGDDVAFFAWAPVALKAVERLQSALGKEFQPEPGAARPNPTEGSESAVSAARRAVTFSFGVAIGDYNTPVRRLRDVAEDVLLKKVKSLSPPGETQGKTAFFVGSNSGELTASQVKRLWRLERRSTPDRPGVLVSIQPVTAKQLGFLLEKAMSLTGEVGRLSRLTAPFLTADPAVALLNYTYTYARARRDRGETAGSPKGKRRPDVFSLLVDPLSNGDTWALFSGNTPSVFPILKIPTYGNGQRTTGIQAAVPLHDLLQLVKVFQ